MGRWPFPSLRFRVLMWVVLVTKVSSCVELCWWLDVLDWTGLERTETGLSCKDQDCCGLECLDWGEVEWSGVDWTGLDWTGLDWTGLGWTGPDWNGRNWTWLDLDKTVSDMDYICQKTVAPKMQMTFITLFKRTWYNVNKQGSLDNPLTPMSD